MIWLVKVGTHRPGYVPQSLNQLLRHIHARKTEFGENHLTERKSDRKLRLNSLCATLRCLNS